MDMASRSGGALTEQNQLLLLIEVVTGYAVYILDPAGRVTSWNQGAHRFTGYASAEIIGRHFSCFYIDEDQKAGLPAQALKIVKRDGKFENEGWRVRKNGSRFWAQVVIDPIRDHAGQIVGFANHSRSYRAKRNATKTRRNS
jgi:PAS domain S-box-containing protein